VVVWILVELHIKISFLWICVGLCGLGRVRREGCRVDFGV
jgi:hypothetical protein